MNSFDEILLPLCPFGADAAGCCIAVGAHRDAARNPRQRGCVFPTRSGTATSLPWIASRIAVSADSNATTSSISAKRAKRKKDFIERSHYSYRENAPARSSGGE